MNVINIGLMQLGIRGTSSVEEIIYIATTKMSFSQAAVCLKQTIKKY